MQAALDLGLIQHGVVLASRHKAVASQLSEHGSRAIQAIQPEQRTLFWEVMGRKIALESLDGLAQFLSVVAVALIAEIAEPLIAVLLGDHRAGAHDLSSLAPGVTRSTQLLQPTLGSRQVCCLRQGALAGRFSGAIDVEDDPTDSTAIHQSPGLPLLRQRAGEQVIEEEAAQGFNWRWGERRQKARERRAGRQATAPKERHERRGKGPHRLVEGLQRAFPTDGVAKEDREKVDHLVVAEAAAGKADALTNLGQDPLLAKMLDDQGGGQGMFSEEDWMITEESAILLM